VRETASLMQARRVFDVVLISLRLPGNEALTRGIHARVSPLTKRSPATNHSALSSRSFTQV
jgi:hypothetical protein